MATVFTVVAFALGWTCVYLLHVWGTGDLLRTRLTAQALALFAIAMLLNALFAPTWASRRTPLNLGLFLVFVHVALMGVIICKPTLH